MEKGNFEGKGDDILPQAVQKQLKWLRCCLGYGLWLAQGNMY